MPSRNGQLRVGRSSIRFAPTPTGLSVIGAALVVVLLSRATVAAIGFFVPLVLAAVLDGLVSWRELARRPISMTPVQRVVTSPNRIKFRVESPAGRHRMQLFLKSFSRLDPDLMPTTLPADGSPVEVELADGLTRARRVARGRISVSALGLCWARRWETHETAPVLRGPAQVDEEVLTVPSSGDLDRLRLYTPGDRMNRVAWGPTARTGDLQVRSTGAGEEEIVVILNLGRDLSLVSPTRNIVDPITGKTVQPLPLVQVGLERAQATVTSLLAQGYMVRLMTVGMSDTFYSYEVDQLVENPRRGLGRFLVIDDDGKAWLEGQMVTKMTNDLVFDADTLIRRLAYADQGPDIEPPPGPYVEVTPVGVTYVRA